MKKALIVWGGWAGHEPEQVAEVFRNQLVANGFEVEVSHTLDAFNDAEKLKSMHLIVPVWTMGSIEPEQCKAVSDAVQGGTGLAGCHGGMCDAFRQSNDWQFMTGGNWVAHPGGNKVEFTVDICSRTDAIVAGVQSFHVTSEQYYLHVDPAVNVLATTHFSHLDRVGPHSPNGSVDMPAVWTKRWGAGRVFYSSLGHNASVFDVPEAALIQERGFVWAAEGKDVALRDEVGAAQIVNA